jgi:glutamine synthetase
MGDREAGAAAGELAAELEKMRADGVETVHVGIFDLNGTFRERRLALDDVAEVFGPGGTFVNVLPQWDAGERLFGAGPFVDEAVALDPATVRSYPFEPGACLLVADYAGPSAALSPRELLRNQIAKAEAKGFGVRAAFEFEFFVLEEDAASLRQSGFSQLETFAKDNRCWAGESAATHAGLVAELQEALAAGGLDLLALGLELGPGCFEATLRQTTPLRAADDAAFFKLFTKAFCRQQDLTASFMAQLGADFPGLSGHLHLSLFDRESGANLFADTGDEYGMSALFRHFVAGLVGLAPEAMPFSHHTVNAYRRLAPGNWAPKSASWARQNYAAAVRVVAAPEERCRLEYRLPGADTNPFMTLAFALGAGLWGLENELPLPPEFGGGGPNDMPADGTSLPHDLFEATERLTGSERAREIWGTSFVDHLIAACRAEEAGLRRETSAAERARYLEVV